MSSNQEQSNTISPLRYAYQRDKQTRSELLSDYPSFCRRQSIDPATILPAVLLGYHEPFYRHLRQP